MTDEEKKRWEQLFKASGVRILCHPDDVQGLPDNEIIQLLVRRFGMVKVFASAELIPGKLLFQPDPSPLPKMANLATKEQPEEEPPWKGLQWYRWFFHKDHPMRVEA